MNPFQNASNLRGRLNKETLDVAKGAYDLPTAVPVMPEPGFSQGGKTGSLKHGGMILGPGTGKSDSIPAKLPVQGFVIPVEAVQQYGPDFFQKFNDAIPSQGKQKTVDAKVSNGEAFIKPEAVAHFGEDFFRQIAEAATGKPAQPEMGMTGEMMAADGGLAQERQAAQQFWQQPNRTLAPIPGRANPANPADMMQARLNTSAQTTPAQAQGLRAQMNTNAATSQPAPPMPTMQKPPMSKPVLQPVASYLNAPKTPTWKDGLLGAGNDVALATSLASDVLQAPQIAQGRDEAIAGLKARAGFKPEATPFAYADGGLVPHYEHGGLTEEERRKNPQTLATFAQPPSVNSPQRSLYEGGQELGRTGLVGFVNKGQQAVQAVNQKYDPAITGAVNKVLYGSEGRPPLAPASLAPTPQTSQRPPTPPTLATASQPPLSPNPARTIPPPDPTTGFRYDSAPQTLDWKESRWSNSGDIPQDTALAERINDRNTRRTLMEYQTNLSRPETTTQYSRDSRGGYSSSTHTGGFSPDMPSLPGSDRPQENRPKYAMQNGTIYQQEGEGAPEFNAQVKPAGQIDPRATQALNAFSIGKDEQEVSRARDYLAKYFPDVFAKYVIGTTQ